MRCEPAMCQRSARRFERVERRLSTRGRRCDDCRSPPIEDTCAPALVIEATRMRVPNRENG
jgi:hypothetical protein